MDPLPYPGDQLIDAAMARALHADARRDHTIVAWVVLWDLPAHPERYAARLVTSGQAAWPSAAGGHTGRDPGDAAAGTGAVRADAY